MVSGEGHRAQPTPRYDCVEGKVPVAASRRTTGVPPSPAPDGNGLANPSVGLAARFWSGTYRNESLAVLALLCLIPTFPLLSSKGPSSVPIEIWILGLVPGATLAMQSLALVLVYRTNRFVNFGQISLGLIGAAFFVYASQYFPLYRLVRSACPPCLGERANNVQYQINYWGSAAIGLGLAVLVSWLMFVLVVKRFAGRPRLTVTVASIFIAPAAVAIVGFLSSVLTTVQQREEGPLVSSSPLPFQWSWEVGSARFSAADILTVLIGSLAIAALGLYLRWSKTGLAIRAASDNPDRAELRLRRFL